MRWTDFWGFCSALLFLLLSGFPPGAFSQEAQSASLPASLPEKTRKAPPLTSAMPLDETFTRDPSLSVSPAASPGKPKRKPWVIGAFPVLVASTDAGLGGGFQLNFFDHRERRRPYDAAYELIMTATSKKEQYHALRLDYTGLWGGAYRLETKVFYNRIPKSQFFGLGNDSPRDPVLEEEGFYDYDRGIFSATSTLRRTLTGHWQLLGQMAARHYTIWAEPDSLLRQVSPAGVEGGFWGRLVLGVAHDSRDSEVWPTRGGFSEIFLQAALAGPEPHAGLALITRRYARLAPRLALAGQLAFDLLFQDPPFYVQEMFGLQSLVGLGGRSTLRGLPRGRFLGKARFLANVEMRFLPLTIRLLGLRLDLGAAAFLDAGRVLEDYDKPLGGLGLHLTQGAGLRVLYERSLAVRFDIGYSHEEEDTRLYINVHHPF